MAEQYPPTIRRKEVDGVPVVKDEVLASGLSNAVNRLVPIHGIRVLTLRTGEVVHGCRDCLTHGTRGEVKAHRISEHGESSGRTRAGNGNGAAGGTGPAVAVNPDTLAMSVGELLELAVCIGDWQAVLDNMQRQRDAAVTDAAEARSQLRVEQRDHRALKMKVRKLVGDS